MTASRKGPDVVVVGAGVIGLACARALVATGRTVTVVDPARPASRASWAAAGMLSPLSESGGSHELRALGSVSFASYPQFVAELESEVSADCGFVRCGKVDVAWSSSRLAVLAAEGARYRADGHPVSELGPDDLRRLEPGLGHGILGGLHFEEDAQIDSRALGAALHGSAAARGAQIVATGAARIRPGAADRGPRVELLDGTDLETHTVVLAAGAWSGALVGGGATLPIRPLHGQMLALRTPDPPPIRGMVHDPDAYLLPREGRVLVGATIEDRGFNVGVDDRAIRRLRDAASRLVPSLTSNTEVERWSGLRPGTPDGLPVLGASERAAGVVFATGHFRNGILWTPVTAALVCDIVDGRAPDLDLEPFSPDRFAH